MNDCKVITFKGRSLRSSTTTEATVSLPVSEDFCDRVWNDEEETRRAIRDFLPGGVLLVDCVDFLFLNWVWSPLPKILVIKI